MFVLMFVAFLARVSSAQEFMPILSPTGAKLNGPKKGEEAALAKDKKTLTPTAAHTKASKVTASPAACTPPL